MLKAKSHSKITLEVVDRRVYHNANMILPYSLSSAGSAQDKGYIAEKPFTQIVRSGLATGLRHMGYTITQHKADYRLVCEIVEVRSAVVQADLQAILKVSFHLYDNKNQAIVWQSFLVGRGNITSFVKDEDDLANAIDASISHVVWSLQESTDFVKAFRG